jgi:pilus assembly protein CpaF
VAERGEGFTFDGVCRFVESLLAPGADAPPAPGAPGNPPGRHGAGTSSGGMSVPELNAQKRAIIGYAEDVGQFMGMVASILDEHGLRGNFEVPPWYETEEEAVFEEIWGKAGMAQWWKPPYGQSGSAKVIGGDIFFMVDGRMERMPQRMGKHRREQLIRAFLLLTPEERLDRDFHEIYLLDGCRVTVFKGGLVKDGLDVIIFRRYVIPEYTFAEQASRGTIPEAAIPLFHAMVKVGFNVVFCGSVRSAKTTFLSTWQRLEDPALEGVMVETDPEVPLHRLMPGAPVVQLIADGERLGQISKNLLRSDADYFIIAEARDGVALDTAVRMARKGTGRMKMTFHTRDPLDFPMDAAVEIVRSVGGDVAETALRAAGSFDYLFHFVSLREGGKKLKGIYEMGVEASGAPGTAGTSGPGIHARNRSEGEGRGYYIREICRYDFDADAWAWTNRIAPDKRARGEEGDRAAFAEFEAELGKLAGEDRDSAAKETESCPQEADGRARAAAKPQAGFFWEAARA